MPKDGLQSKLTLFDVTNLVVGAIIGADIYVASSFGAGFLGPLSLAAWIVAGFIAVVIALCFAQCATLLPKVGGPYAYARDAWGPFAGFIVGWALWIAEWLSLAVFPVAFTRYLMFFLPDLNWAYQVAVKMLFVFFLVATNIVGVKAAGRINDILTIIKLGPLIFFSISGILYMAANIPLVSANYTPFSPFGFDNFGGALVLIFWAYAGFEISTLPADEIKEPSKTIPKAIVLGMSIVMVFYLTTNIVLFGVRPWAQIALDNAPLASATGTMLGNFPSLALIGGLIVGIGALFSVAGSDESGMIGTSRLGYALAVDGLFPKLFAKINPRFKTPYTGILIQGITALAASIVGNLTELIATSVFFMAIAYIATSLSIFWLRRKTSTPKANSYRGSIIPILGAAFSLYLITQCAITQIVIGSAILLIGIPIYLKYSPKKELTGLKNAFLSRSYSLEVIMKREERFLAHPLVHLKNFYRKITGSK